MNNFLVVIILIICVMIYKTRENFATKRDKAETIYNWFTVNHNPLYTLYKQNMGKDSNIVEYEDVLKLMQNKRLSIDNIQKLI